MQPMTVSTRNNIDGLKQVPLDQIRPKAYEFREKEVDESDDFQELFLSIKIHGVLQPITLREQESAKYQIIDGGRRYNACKLLGMKTIPAVIRREIQSSPKVDIVLSYVQNVQSKQLSDIEKARAIRTIYENNGFDLQTALQYLNNIRNNKYSDQTLKVPSEFIDLANSIGRANSTQWFLLKLLKDVPAHVLKYAEQVGLDREKKQMLTYPSIKKDPELQKAVINIIKDAPKESARQLVHNIETGAYRFTGKGFKVIAGESEQFKTKPSEFSMDAFVSFNEATNLAKKLSRKITGIESIDYSTAEIKQSRDQRLERLKRLSERDLNLYWNILKPLNALIADQISLLESELESRQKNGKLLQP